MATETSGVLIPRIAMSQQTFQKFIAVQESLDYLYLTRSELKAVGGGDGG